MAAAITAITWSCLVITNVIFLMQSISGAPLIKKDLDTNLTEQESITKNSTHASLLEDGLFEGDLIVSEDFIRQYYDLSSGLASSEEYNSTMAESKDYEGSTVELEDTKSKEKRAAKRNSLELWTNGKIPYRYSSSIPMDWRNSIRNAMDHWEDRTCLRFTLRNHESDYVEYIRERTTCSSALGKSGGRQEINLNRDHSCGFPTIVHEIGHTVGFWHEQSRPDRDYYVRINCPNVEIRRRRNFLKQSYSQVDSLGSEYDYGSVMHYATDKFAREDCSGCQTIEVINYGVYRAQGSPRIGQWTGLSTSDIEQANRLYSCPKRGVMGLLVVHVRDARSLPDTDPVLNNPDPYVKITAVDSSGRKHVRQTSVKSGTTTPDWNEYLILSEREWQFFRIQIWDDDHPLSDDHMTISETIVPTRGQHNHIRHCSNDNCNAGYVTYDYSIYSLTRAALTVYVRYARNLQDTDPIWNSPDPYVTMQAVSSEGSHTKSTSYVDGTQNPTWNTVLNFGCRRWANFIFHQVWDSDSGFTGGDDDMSWKQRTSISSGNHQNNRHGTYGGGYMIFDYNFVIDGNECRTNPCQNGGTCVDGCASYTCRCRSGYSGTHCEHLSANLRFKARYARNLPDSDGWWNDSDPYMQIIAVDADGNTVTKTTSYLSGDHNPDWNQWLYFGTRAWKRFKVTIYDSDYDADDPLSNQFIWPVNLGSYTNQRFNCHSGYAVFDFYFD